MGARFCIINMLLTTDLANIITAYPHSHLTPHTSHLTYHISHQKPPAPLHTLHTSLLTSHIAHPTIHSSHFAHYPHLIQRTTIANATHIHVFFTHHTSQISSHAASNSNTLLYTRSRFQNLFVNMPQCIAAIFDGCGGTGNREHINQLMMSTKSSTRRFQGKTSQ